MTYDENSIRLRVSFDAPENTTIVLQGPALEAYYRWLNDDSDEASWALEEAIMEQCEDHIASWTTLREWDNA